ncbi:MAG: asparagine synthase (glutamine-hydrolyzing) [Gammaproteobacteria bacterium]
MCGFVATISASGKAVDEVMLARMCDSIAHRGPDGTGTFIEGAVGFGFRRLAIFDLAPTGNQPMTSADGRYVIVFNGAIYNFIELRNELVALGHVFRSTGDTEVLLAAWQQWGRACLPRLNGMWAFLIYDRVERRIHGARDRFGVKPLFWFRDSDRLIFSSEIKAIHIAAGRRLELDRQTIATHLLEDRLDSNTRTLYAGVSRVPAGTAFEVDSSGRIEWRPYWSLLESAASVPMPSDPVQAYADLFEDAVKLRMRSDVPVGVLLSGGLDSTTIMCSMARLLGPANERQADLVALCYMDPQFDESPFIHATLQQTGGQLEKLETTPRQLWDALGQHLWHQDEPVHSFTSVVVHQLMQLARARGVKVVLNGQGADEVLAGYRSYFSDYWLELMRAGRFATARHEIAAFARANGQSSNALFRRTAQTYLQQLLHWMPGYAPLARSRHRAAMLRDPWVSPEVQQHWVQADSCAWGSLSEALRWSLEKVHLPLYLRTEDRNSMAHGIELRLPFLDYRLVSLAFRLGSDWKIRGEYTKVLLREAMRNRIPENVRSRAQKFGFPTSVDQWFRGELFEPLKDLLGSRAVRESNLWNMAQVQRDLERHRRGEVNLSGRLFDVAQVSLLVSDSTRL